MSLSLGPCWTGLGATCVSAPASRHLLTPPVAEALASAVQPHGCAVLFSSSEGPGVLP